MDAAVGGLVGYSVVGHKRRGGYSSFAQSSDARHEARAGARHHRPGRHPRRRRGVVGEGPGRRHRGQRVGAGPSILLLAAIAVLCLGLVGLLPRSAPRNSTSPRSALPGTGRHQALEMTAPVRTSRAPSFFSNEAGASSGASSEPRRPGSPSPDPPGRAPYLEQGVVVELPLLIPGVTPLKLQSHNGGVSDLGHDQGA